jgi:hypothetical protein
VPTNGVQLILNGIDVSSALVFTGTSSNWTVTFPYLEPNVIYSAIINATNANGESVTTSELNFFDTFSQSNLMIEGEDFDFGGGHFIDNPVPTAEPATNSYYMEATQAIVGVDLTTPNNIGGEQFEYRNDSCGTQEASDYLREKFITAGVPDYNVGWWYTGAWLNYTRTYPTNEYHIYARLASADGAYGATNYLVTGGVGTSNQQTQLLGTFSSVDSGWQTWQWVPLANTNGQTAVVSLGGVRTMKMASANDLNANFYMFVPVPSRPHISVAVVPGGPRVSFPTQAGFDYMLVYKNNLKDEGYWKLVSVASGDGTTKTLTDGTGAGPSQRFYAVVVQ